MVDSSDPSPAYRSPSVLLALSYFEAIDSEDNERLSTFLTETFEWRWLSTGMINSIKNKSQFLTPSTGKSKKKGVKTVILDVIEAVDSRVIAHIRNSGTLGPKDTSFEWESMHIFSFSPGPDGKPLINEVRTFMDLLSQFADFKRGNHAADVWDIALVRATLMPCSPGAAEIKAKTTKSPQCLIM